MDNLRGAALMTLSMLAFAFEDMLIKLLGDRIPAGQIIALIGFGGAVCFGLWLKLRGLPLFVPEFRNPRVLLRIVFEVLGTMLFISALTRMDLTLLSALVQATPLLVALGGVVFLGQAVGWKRWAAILLGFFGILLIVKPGAGSFDATLLIGVFGVTALAARDLATRAITVTISGIHLSFQAMLSLVPAGIVLMWIDGTQAQVPLSHEYLLLVLCVVITLLAYLTIITATRTGDAAFISMFRYTRMIFALALGMIVLGERPDTLTLLGAAIIIGAGGFTLIREARARRTSQASPEPI